MALVPMAAMRDASLSEAHEGHHGVCIRSGICSNLKRVWWWRTVVCLSGQVESIGDQSTSEGDSIGRVEFLFKPLQDIKFNRLCDNWREPCEVGKGRYSSGIE